MVVGYRVAIAANALDAALTDGTSVMITGTQAPYIVTCAIAAIGRNVVVLGHWL